MQTNTRAVIGRWGHRAARAADVVLGGLVAFVAVFALRACVWGPWHAFPEDRVSTGALAVGALIAAGFAIGGYVRARPLLLAYLLPFGLVGFGRPTEPVAVAVTAVVGLYAARTLWSAPSGLHALARLLVSVAGASVLVMESAVATHSAPVLPVAGCVLCFATIALLSFERTAGVLTAAGAAAAFAWSDWYLLDRTPYLACALALLVAPFAWPMLRFALRSDRTSSERLTEAGALRSGRPSREE